MNAPTLENRDAENAVLGSILVDPECLWLVRGVLKPTDFSLTRNQQVYEAMLSLADRGEALDIVTIPDEIQRNGGNGHSAEAAPYLAGLMADTPSAVNALSYAETVADDARRRALLRLSSELARRIHDKGAEIDQTVSWLTAAATAESRGGEIRHARDVVETVYAEFDRNVKEPLAPGEVRGVDTGWRDLNRALGGWRPGLYVVLGEPHVGKSWFVGEAAANVAMGGQRALLFSLEMTAEQIVRRNCLAYAGASQLDYDLGRIPAHQQTRMFDRMAQIEDWDLDIVDDQDSAGAIFATIHRECRGPNPPAVVCIDYLGIIATDYRNHNRNEELSELLRAMKRLSDQCQIPLLVPHQISDKAVEMRHDKRPRKSDGYASGGISQHADVILGLFNESMHTVEPENPNALEVITLKDRLSGKADPFSRTLLSFAETGGLRDYSKRDEPGY